MFTICSYFVHIYKLQYNCNKVTDTQAIAKKGGVTAAQPH